MEITSAEILKKLPDFNDLLDITEKIAATAIKKLTLDKAIKEKEAQIIKEAMTNPIYQVSGKAPSMALIAATYSYTGFNGEMLPLRQALIEATVEQEKLKARLDLYKEFLGMWRSLNASERVINAG